MWRRAMFQNKSRNQTGISIIPFDEPKPEQRVPAPLSKAEPVKTPAVQRARPSHTKRDLLIAVDAAALVAAAGWFGFQYATVRRFMISTDDAYVRAYNATVGAKVSGYVADLPVDDNTKVHAGDVVARIDDGDYRLAVDSAREKVGTQQATIERLDHQVVAQQAAVEQAKAQ